MKQYIIKIQPFNTTFITITVINMTTCFHIQCNYN